jgi:hypothetical protein
MFRSLVGAVLVLVLGVGVALAAEIRAIITKVDGNKITFSENKGKGERGPAQTLPVADNVKVTQMKFNRDTKKLEAGDALKDGLKNEMFSKIGEKGVGATIVTDADNKKITEIRVGGFGGGFKKKKDK